MPPCYWFELAPMKAIFNTEIANPVDESSNSLYPKFYVEVNAIH